jgi:transcriptional regulator
MAKKAATNGGGAPKREPAAKRNKRALALRRKGKSYSEIAQELGTAVEGATPVSASRARQMVRDGIQAEAEAAVAEGATYPDWRDVLKALNTKARGKADKAAASAEAAGE